jgi:transcriptional regulator with XRE-family HTH domain
MANSKHGYPFKITITEMADRLGITRAYLASILSGALRPGGPLAFRIEAETRGKIKAKDLITRKSHQSNPAA